MRTQSNEDLNFPHCENFHLVLGEGGADWHRGRVVDSCPRGPVFNLMHQSFVNTTGKGGGRPG